MMILPKISIRGVIAAGIALVLASALGFGAYYFLHLKNAPPLKLDMEDIVAHKRIPQKDNITSEETHQEVTAKNTIAKEGKELATLAATDKQKNDPQRQPTSSTHGAIHENSTDKDSLVCLPTPKGLTLIVTGLGLDASITDRAIRELPSYVILSFSSYAKMLNQWIHPSKSAGHTILIELSNEKELESFGLITYFDGILMKSGKEPITHPKALTDFIITVSDMQKILVEGRLLLENSMIKEAEKQNVLVHRVTQSLSQETIFLDKQDVLSQKGVVTLPASLVPYLIDYLNEKRPKESVFTGF
ncbi:MAG: hypothetical protein K2X98_06230 [Alphaproteobacteria bacterium]|nr:hypothetical protein [Alphaproteobacteria bacterium]